MARKKERGEQQELKHQRHYEYVSICLGMSEIRELKPHGPMGSPPTHGST